MSAPRSIESSAGDTTKSAAPQPSSWMKDRPRIPKPRLLKGTPPRSPKNTRRSLTQKRPRPTRSAKAPGDNNRSAWKPRGGQRKGTARGARPPGCARTAGSLRYQVRPVVNSVRRNTGRPAERATPQKEHSWKPDESRTHKPTYVSADANGRVEEADKPGRSLASWTAMRRLYAALSLGGTVGSSQHHRHSDWLPACFSPREVWWIALFNRPFQTPLKPAGTLSGSWNDPGSQDFPACRSSPGLSRCRPRPRVCRRPRLGKPTGLNCRNSHPRR